MIRLSDNRNERLAADYREMLKLQNRPYLSWIVTKGEPPYAEEYLLSVSLRSYALTASDERYIVGVIDRCTVKVELWGSYPHIAPNIRMLNIPPVFHPNWYSKGTYCPKEAWRPDTPLKDYVIQMLGTIAYVPDAIETAYPANYKALDWFRRNQDSPDLFPSDKTVLSENTPEEARAAEQAAAGFGKTIDSWRIR